MPIPILIPIALNVININGSTVISERKLMNPKQVGVFYVGIAKSCYILTVKKRVACIGCSCRRCSSCSRLTSGPLSHGL
jgi:hypothetical protein